MATAVSAMHRNLITLLRVIFENALNAGSCFNNQLVIVSDKEVETLLFHFLSNMNLVILFIDKTKSKVEKDLSSLGHSQHNICSVYCHEDRFRD